MFSASASSNNDSLAGEPLKWVEVFCEPQQWKTESALPEYSGAKQLTVESPVFESALGRTTELQTMKRCVCVCVCE